MRMSAALLLLFLVSLVLIAWSNNPTLVPDQDGDGYRDLVFNNGIHAAPNLEAVYLEGEACTLNAHEGVSWVEFQRNLRWCEEQFRGDRARHALVHR